MTDGRRFRRWDEAPDPGLPCPDCERPWSEHEGEAEMAVRGGHAGLLLPPCPE